MFDRFETYPLIERKGSASAGLASSAASFLRLVGLVALAALPISSCHRTVTSRWVSRIERVLHSCCIEKEKSQVGVV